MALHNSEVPLFALDFLPTHTLLVYICLTKSYPNSARPDIIFHNAVSLLHKLDKLLILI
ncbi:hypothetical protein VCRA2116O372_90084 [Vibrio crassostreae]|nr:hypothetical protein VCRA2116O372_90084 [Vibrio crassostreae]CAK2587218.1 hypothetical protein VCRA2116O374_80084 [Vibrio crassostreae]CAK2598788.1 hypothetical protein VCRA2117O377_90084 [Vibrio crassostreae]CAK2785550.1 hypothetical protein VCRA2119O384_20084 [Vibrio crassostreae]CAK2859300.1 hypothetical protein VCRA2134O405_20084 [Vibrio crassostreae]